MTPSEYRKKLAKETEEATTATKPAKTRKKTAK